MPELSGNLATDTIALVQAIEDRQRVRVRMAIEPIVLVELDESLEPEGFRYIPDSDRIILGVLAFRKFSVFNMFGRGPVQPGLN